MKYNIPLKHEPRAVQIDALEHIKTAVKDGKKFALGNMPTGTGKSYEVVMFAHWWKNSVEDDTSFTVLTESRMLQEQYVMDFDFMYNMWGRSNYRCEMHSTNCQNGAEMAAVTKRKCENCPYVEARKQFVDSTIGITNYHMHLTHHMHLFDKVMEPRLAHKKNILIVDEAHAFEDIFCSFVSLSLNSFGLKKLGFTENETLDILNQVALCENIDKFHNYLINDFYQDLIEKESSLEERAKKASGDKLMDLMRKAKEVTTMQASIDYFSEHYEKEADNWIYQLQEDKYGYSGKVIPIWGRKLIMDTIWKYYDFVLLLSGTIINPATFCYMNGIKEDQVHYFDLPSPFPLDNRPFYCLPVGKMNFRNKREVFDKQWEMLKKIASRHKGQKGVFHTQTYEIANWIMERAGKGKRLLSHKTAKEKDEMIREHYDSPNPTVIVSPSVQTGLDLRDDYSRFQVILKVPYPNMGDDRVKKRMEQLPQWYADQTILQLLQMYGRSVRSVSDWAHTYILDGNFTRLYAENSHHIPQYFKEAVKFIKV